MKSTNPANSGLTRPNSLLARFGWALAEGWTITMRDLNHWRFQPGGVIVGWLFPVMIVLMFGLLFGGAIKVPEGADYFEFLMPGIFAMTMLFGLETTVIAVTTDISKGVTDRFRSMPISGSAVVLGRCFADMLNSLVGLAIMVGTGLGLGWRWHAGLAAALAALGLLLLLRFGLLWIGIFIGLKAKGPETVTSVQILVWPVGFLSNIFVDPSTMPSWLGIVAQANPLSTTALATRELFGNPVTQADSWLAQNSLLLAIFWPLLLTAIFVPLSVSKYRRLSR